MLTLFVSFCCRPHTPPPLFFFIPYLFLSPPCFFPTCISPLGQTRVCFPKHFLFFFFPFYCSLPHDLPILFYSILFLFLSTFFAPSFPVWVHRIGMWGAAALLTKHKAFHIHPAPGILGCCSVVSASMWERRWEGAEEEKGNTKKKKRKKNAFCP